MKIAVFADFHGSTAALQTAAEICKRERPDKTVICGDLFGWSSSPVAVAELLSKLDGVLYLVRGNNDYVSAQDCLPVIMERECIMYHFGRTLFFTHGDRYDGLRVPPILRQGDALVYGHTHAGRLCKYNGIFALNVGSLARPRNGLASYLILDETGSVLKQPDGAQLASLAWD